MNKIAIVAIVGIAFLAGGIIGNADLVVEATGGNGDGAWAKLVARVTGLESQLGGNSIRTVVLHDDEEGHAKGWNPDDSGNTVFLIVDDQLTSNSIVYAQVLEDNICTTVRFPFEGFLALTCPASEGYTLSYVVIDPLVS